MPSKKKGKGKNWHFKKIKKKEKRRDGRRF